MNHAEANPDLTAVDAAIRHLIQALDYPEHEIDNITILNNGIIRVATRDHAMRGVVTRAFSREAPKAEGAPEVVVETKPEPVKAEITVTKTPARAGAK